MDPISFLNEAWWTWFLGNYKTTAAVAFGVLVFLLKLVAVVHPGVPTDRVVDLLRDSWPIKAKAGE